MKKILMKLGMCFSFINIMGCSTDTIVEYIHQPSKNFDLNYDMNVESIQPYLYRDTVIVSTIKGVDYDNKYDFWIGFFSVYENKQVTVKKVKISGDAWAKEYQINKAYSINHFFTKEDLDLGLINSNYFDKTPLFDTSVLLFDLPGSRFRDADESLSLDVYYEVDGYSHHVTFDFEKRVKEMPIFPT